MDAPRPTSATNSFGWHASMIHNTADKAEMVEETESHFASRPDVCNEAVDDETEY
ncbi:hypothetical protein Hanom_Chr14g01273911 [Helianthus anomalus]